MGDGSTVVGSSNGGRAPKNILKLNEPKLSILRALKALVKHVICVGVLVWMSQIVPSLNSVLTFELSVEDEKPVPVMVMSSPPAGLRLVFGLTLVTTSGTEVFTILLVFGMRPFASLTTGSQSPAIRGEARSHEIVVASLDETTQLISATVTDAMVVGRLVPLIDTDCPVTLMEVISPVTGS